MRIDPASWQWLVDAIMHVSHQVRRVEQKVDLLLQGGGITLPPELVQAGKDLAVKTKALQAAIDSQASQPTTKGP